MGWSRQFIEKVRMRQTLPLSLATSVTLKCGPKVKLNCHFQITTKNPILLRTKFSNACCGEGGDSLEFIEVIENCDFNEAVKKLADRAGIIPSNDELNGGGAGEDKRKD